MDMGSSQPHNLGTCSVSSYCWGGAEVHVVQQHVLPGPAWHKLCCNRLMLSLVVNELGGHCVAQLATNDRVSSRPAGTLRHAGHINFVPPGLSLWGYTDFMERIDEVRLIFDADHLGEIIGDEVRTTALTEPRLMFFDEKLLALARLLKECDASMHRFSLFCDSVITAIIARLVGMSDDTNSQRRRLGLAPSQVTRVTGLMQERVGESLRLSDLAALVGLSASQFSRAFKASTGTTPHKWHLDARIGHAKRLLVNRHNSIVQIALDSGFSEQSHFTRAFRAATGTSPHVWRRARLT